MAYATENIARALKEARERKGLSQRALGALSGIHQYQISKFENGAIDLRLSSLIELARALDLELTLVPRKSVSAVKTIVSGGETKGATAPALKELNRTLDAIKTLRAVHPHLSDLNKLQNTIQSFKNLHGIGEEMDALRKITKPVREIRKRAGATKTIDGAIGLPAEQLRAVREAADAAQKLRDRLVHDLPEPRSSPRPAYSLDEDDNG